MEINGEILKSLEVFPSMTTVPDCMVVESNKLGKGHGEAKLYIASKDTMRDFYGGAKFSAKCIMLKSDLLSYMNAIKMEYMQPSQPYNGRNDFPKLWSERVAEIQALPDVIEFRADDQYQITGNRGYVNSDDDGYMIIRKIALPLVSFISCEKLVSQKNPIFYWRLFADFDTIKEKKNGPLVFNYGKKNENAPGVSLLRNSDENTPVVCLKASSAEDAEKKEEQKQDNIRQAREGQGKYREKLLAQCHFCPVTMISDERLLVASHIKPWAASDDKEKVDPYNGYALSPMIDKLFDRGFLTFTSDKHILLSEYLSPTTWRLIGLKDGAYIQNLLIDNKRLKYLQFHHDSVFKGQYKEN